MDINRSDIPPVNRESAADFILRNAERIRAVARRNLTRHAQCCVGSDDILSSVLRRVDEMSASQDLRPVSDAELWRLIERITVNTAASYTRVLERATTFLANDGDYAHASRQMQSSTADPEDTVALAHKLLTRLRQDDNHQLFLLRMRGASHAVIAQCLGISETAARKRWSTICRDILSQFDSIQSAQA